MPLKNTRSSHGSIIVGPLILSWVSLPVLSSFTQNLKANRCSNERPMILHNEAFRQRSNVQVTCSLQRSKVDCRFCLAFPTSPSTDRAYAVRLSSLRSLKKKNQSYYFQSTLYIHIYDNGYRYEIWWVSMDCGHHYRSLNRIVLLSLMRHWKITRPCPCLLCNIYKNR